MIGLEKKRGIKIVVFVLLGIILATPFLIAYNGWGGGYYFSSPSDLLENEWTLFVILFAIFYVISFISLKKFFIKKEMQNKGTLVEKEDVFFEDKPLVALLSAAISFLISAGLVRNEFVAGYIGEALASWLLVLVLIVIIILLVSFFKSLSYNVGVGPALIIIVIFVWIVLKFTFDPYDLEYHIESIRIPFEFYEFYDAITSYTALFIGIVVSIVGYSIFKGFKGSSDYNSNRNH